MPDRDDLRGAALATLNVAGMMATIVGVPVLTARRLVRRRQALVLPTALGIAAALTIATQRTGWRLVKLWLGIDRTPGESHASGR